MYMYMHACIATFACFDSFSSSLSQVGQMRIRIKINSNYGEKSFKTFKIL